jgi:hypothetical protein
MRTPANTLVQFRLSRPEVRHIRVGLYRVMAEHQLWDLQGRRWYSAYCAHYVGAVIDEGEYSIADMARIAAVFDNLQEVPGATKRLHMNVFELAVCMLGVRATPLRVRHGHMQAWLPDHRAATRALLRKLERLRKRAKRRYIRVCGLAALGASWPTLSLKERSNRLRALVDKGHDRRSLGRFLDCSEGLVRHLLRLQDLTEEEKKAVTEGSLSLRAALRRLKARTVVEHERPRHQS